MNLRIEVGWKGVPQNVQTINMLGRTVKVANGGVSWEGDLPQKDIMVLHFGVNDSTKVLNNNEQSQGVPHAGGEAELHGPRQSAAAAPGEGGVCKSVARPSVSDFAES